MTIRYKDTMKSYISPGWDFGDYLGSAIVGNREVVLEDRWGAGWFL